jgi:hypothetical protein
MAIDCVKASLIRQVYPSFAEVLRWPARTAIAAELEQFVTPGGIERKSTRIVAVAFKPGY